MRMRRYQMLKKFGGLYLLVVFVLLATGLPTVASQDILTFAKPMGAININLANLAISYTQNCSCSTANHIMPNGVYLYVIIRGSKLDAMKIRMAHFPLLKTLDQFDSTFRTGIDSVAIGRLGKYGSEREPRAGPSLNKNNDGRNQFRHVAAIRRDHSWGDN